MLPGYTHNIINLSETENLVTVMWANEKSDPEGRIRFLRRRESPLESMADNRNRTTIKRNEWSVAQIIYAVLMGGLLCSYLLILAFDHYTFPLPAWLALIRLTVAVFGFCLGKLWKEKGFLIIASLLVIQILRVVFQNTQLMFTDSVSTCFFNGLWAVAGCYSLGRILSVNQLKRFLKIVAAVWTIGIVIHCSIALYATWTDQEIINLYGKTIVEGGAIWGLFWLRLSIGYLYPTVSGSALSVSGIIALLVIFAAKKMGTRILYGIALLIIVVALSLTDARTSYISFSAGNGVSVGVCVLWCIKKRKNEMAANHVFKKSHYAWLFAAVSAAAICCFSLILISRITPLFNFIKTKGDLLISTARAEEPALQKLQVMSRGLSGSNVLSGRLDVWKSVARYVLTDPIRILWGSSVFNPMTGPNQLSGEPMAHCHNMFIQVFLESGILGLIPVFSFGVYTVANAIKIINKKDFPLWINLLTAIPVSVLVGDLAECFGCFAEWKGPALPFLFVSVGIINSLGNRKFIETEESLA